MMKRYINIRGELYDLSVPRVMGIINLTPDSFYPGSRINGEPELRKRVEEMLEEGADIIDIGSVSTRPGAVTISAGEEFSRLESPLSVIRKNYPEAIISVDTFQPEVARRVIENFGIDIVNDVYAGRPDDSMISLVAEKGVPYILMHMQGTPATMQDNPHYKDVVGEINYWFSSLVNRLSSYGARDIILDPGFGFGKTVEHNFTMLSRFSEFRIHKLPLLAGMSRKSMIWKQLGVTPGESLTGTVVLNTLALERGASILRVHDVREARELIDLCSHL